MPLQLREPFFLKGRTSVVQRAVIMSLVLGGLAGIAAWLVVLTYMSIQLSFVMTAEMQLLVVPLVWSVWTPLLINGPLNAWNGRSAWWTIAAAPASLGIMAAFFFWGEYAATKIPFAWMLLIGIPATLLVCGMLLIRCSRRHAIALLISCLGGTIPVFIDAAIRANSNMQSSLGIRQELWQLLCLVALSVAWLSALAIPWGLPFWWPPEKDAGAEA